MKAVSLGEVHYLNSPERKNEVHIHAAITCLNVILLGILKSLSNKP